ncbi:hypothetical protein JCM4914_48380 [Streptomyces platensis subsp. malvinus]
MRIGPVERILGTAKGPPYGSGVSGERVASGLSCVPQGSEHRIATGHASDHRHGGQPGIEQKAAALADEALALQSSGSASQRVRAYIGPAPRYEA